MYRALKNAQSEINESLLKFADEVIQVVEKKEVSPDLAQSIQLMNRTMSSILDILVSQKPSCCNTCKCVQDEKSSSALQTSETIPFIQATASNVDLQNVGNTEVEYEEVEVDDEVEEEEVDEEEVEVEEEEVEEEEVEVEEEEVEVEEEEVEVEEEEVDANQLKEADLEEEELEVEEWLYKGSMYFKDSDNTVYANDGGEVGDAIGRYDPVKKVVKKLPPS